MSCTREELFQYLTAVFQVTPKRLPTIQDFTALVHRHRAGEPVQRELLAAMAPLLGRLVSRYQHPGDLVSDFWEAAKKKDTPLDIAAQLRDYKKTEIKSDQRRTRSHETYQAETLGDASDAEEGLPPWFGRLPLSQQRVLWGVLRGEEDREVGAAQGITDEAAKKRRKRLFEELRKKLVPPTSKRGPSEE